MHLALFSECVALVLGMFAGIVVGIVLGGFRALGLFGMFANCLETVPAKSYKCVGDVLNMFWKHLGMCLNVFASIFVCGVVMHPCENLFSARFARRFPFIFAKYCKNPEKFLGALRAPRISNNY